MNGILNSSVETKNLKPFLFILPSFFIAFLVITYPIIDLFVLSLNKVGTFGRIEGFSGFLNYSTILLQDKLFYEVLFRTFIWTLFVVIGTVLISIPISLVLIENFYGKGIARTIIMLPWSVSLAMTAVIWRWLLNGDYGMINHILSSLNLIDSPIGWLASSTTAFPMQIFIGILVSIPFTISILLGGLTSIPTDIYESASLDGGSYVKMIRTITLPLLKPFISIAIVLNVIYVFNSFPIIWILTKGGPANTTDILPTYLYKLAFEYGDIGPAAALSLIMLFILLTFTFIYAMMVMKNES